MSYHVYTTPGIILKRSPFGESDILLHVLTLDFGLIIASAKSARVFSSKLRSALQEYSDVSLSCIKSKNGWKITNVVERGNYYFTLPDYSHKVLAQIGQVVLKMIPGESPHKEIFETISSGFEFLKNVKEEELANFEAVIVLRMMKELGYVVPESKIEKYVSGNLDWSFELLNQVSIDRVYIVSLINKAIKESQL